MGRRLSGALDNSYSSHQGRLNANCTVDLQDTKFRFAFFHERIVGYYSSAKRNARGEKVGRMVSSTDYVDTKMLQAEMTLRVSMQVWQRLWLEFMAKFQDVSQSVIGMPD